MSRDRSVVFYVKKKKLPSYRALTDALIAYIGKSGRVTRKKGGWLFVHLIGKQSTPSETRWVTLDRRLSRSFEVWPTTFLDGAMITTRSADEFTNAVANGFALFCECKWGGLPPTYDRPRKNGYPFRG